MKTYIITEKDIERLKEKFSFEHEDKIVDRWEETLKVHSNLDMQSLNKKFNEILENTTKEDMEDYLNFAKKE